MINFTSWALCARWNSTKLQLAFNVPDVFNTHQSFVLANTTLKRECHTDSKQTSVHTRVFVSYTSSEFEIFIRVIDRNVWIECLLYWLREVIMQINHRLPIEFEQNIEDLTLGGVVKASRAFKIMLNMFNRFWKIYYIINEIYISFHVWYNI